MMTAGDLKAAARRLYGPHGWQMGLAAALGVNAATVRRWTSGTVPVPGPVAAAVKCFEQQETKR